MNGGAEANGLAPLPRACARVNRAPCSLEKHKQIMIDSLRFQNVHLERIIAILCMLSESSNVRKMDKFVSGELEKTRF